MNVQMLRTARHGMRGAIVVLLAGVLAAIAESASADPACGDPFVNAFGPFDYRTATRDERSKVERFHFTADVATLRRGASSGQIGGDISYTLKVFPNHPRALLAMSDLARKQKVRKPTGAEYDVDCWFDRAIRFRPDDGRVRLVYGISLLKDQQVDQAIEQLTLADTLLPKRADVHYNLGLAYFERQDFDKALQHAKIAYGMGIDLPGLRDKLTRSGHWK